MGAHHISDEDAGDVWILLDVPMRRHVVDRAAQLLGLRIFVVEREPDAEFGIVLEDPVTARRQRLTPGPQQGDDEGSGVEQSSHLCLFDFLLRKVEAGKEVGNRRAISVDYTFLQDC